MSVKVRMIEGGLGEITQGFSSTHEGMDIVNKDYTLGNIVAHSDGEVVEIVKDCNYNTYPNGARIYGNYVKLKHADGYYTLYGHGAYNTVKVNKGDKVKRGQVLFYMGNTGYSNGGHVHFEVRTPKDVRINPDPYLDADLPKEVELPQPVERNKNVTQLQVIETQLNVRLDHSTSAQSIGFCPVGIYNIISEYKDNSYIWYEIEKGKWVANEGTWCKILPAEKNEIVLTKDKYDELCKQFWDYLKDKCK